MSDQHTADSDHQGTNRQQRAVATTKARYGKNFYKEIGTRAGKNSKGGPFSKDPLLARKAVNARWERYYAMSEEEQAEYREQLRAKRRAKKEAQAKVS